MPPAIIIVGLGPGSSQHCTQAAADCLSRAVEVYTRAKNHPGLAGIQDRVRQLDSLYEQADDPARAHRQAAVDLVRLGQRVQGVVYATPGNPRLDEPALPFVLELAASHGLSVSVIPGISLLETILPLLGLSPGEPLQLVTAGAVAGLHHPPLAPDQPAIISQLYGPELAGRVKKTLLNGYKTELEVTLIETSDSETAALRSCHLADLDRQPGLDRLIGLYLPADTGNASLTTFQETVAHLRAPEGCPWDREQTHLSLRPFLLEETYEVLEALDAGNPAALAEELGDLLLQIALHAQIATEASDFKMGDIINHINRKLLRRHPHVFGDVAVSGVREVMVNWDAIKKEEKAKNNRDEATAENPAESALDGLPRGLPALAEALAISRRAVRVGFEWPDIEGVLDKLIEEAREITEATDPAHLEAEIGDLLFSAVNLARWRNVDPESALRATNARFARRFRKIETLAAARGKSLSEMSIEEMDALWEQAKLSAE